MTNQQKLVSLLPKITTGNLVMDTSLRVLMVAGASLATGAAIEEMKDHGVDSAYVIGMVPDFVWALVGTLVAGGMAWWQGRAKKSITDLAVTGAIVASQTGRVPEEVKQIATTGQLKQIAAAGK